MGTISISLPSDGTTADVADVNTPLTTIQNVINGNIDSNNLAANAVTTAKLTDGAVTSAKLAGIDKSLITVDSNPYKFSVYRNAAWTAGSGFAKVQFDTELFDTNNNYDNATNYRYTAPVAGFYQFSTSISQSGVNNGAVLALALYKNGVEIKRLQTNDEVFQSSGTAAPTIGGGAMIQLAATDYVEVFYSSNGTAGVAGALFTWFTGFLMCRT